jgi:non-lysosomal glucosylceramidase
MLRFSRRRVLELCAAIVLGGAYAAHRLGIDKRLVSNAPPPGQHQGIPSAAWTRPIGEALPDPGLLAPGQDQIDDGYWQGVPLGGLGSGTIGRSYRGDFARWHLDVGRHYYAPVLANQFSVRVEDRDGVRSTVLCTERPTDRLSAWSWTYPAGHGTYAALFPKAWFVYDPKVVGCELTIKQFSPVIPRNYRESSFPVAVFDAEARNTTDRALNVSLMLTWQNLVGWDRGVWRHAGQVNRAQTESIHGRRMVGVVLDGPSAEPRDRWDGQFAIATTEVPGTSASSRARFSADGDGSDVWADFVADGQLDNALDDASSAEGEELGAAVAISFRLDPGQSTSVQFVVAWDLPIMRFGPDGGGRQWYRRYTAFFGNDGRNAWSIARTALSNYQDWEAAIDDWQLPILAESDRPDWYKTALFNELYYLVDGGTAWENGEVGNPAQPEGRFAVLECYDYPFYSTLDVRFYSSWALLLLWPELEKQELRQFARTVGLEDLTPVVIQSDGQPGVRKRAGALPHDLGAPDDDPWLRPNSYTWQDINIWKDLNSKFVLTVYRDYILTHDRSLVIDCWPAVIQSLAYLKQFDRDGDGLPENDGVPDQTYDTWAMVGPSAYCGGLWLAALRAAEAMGALLGEVDSVRLYQTWRGSAEVAYERLWNGTSYRFDSSQGGHADTIMADQLCGAWYAQACGLPNVVAAERVRQVLRTVYVQNVLGFGGGRMGAVNGTRPDGSVDLTCDQSQEVWSGVSYALAAFMLQNGMTEEALHTASGVYEVTYRTRGFWFRTPEAWNRAGSFRASMYLRPLAIWAMQHARTIAQPA